MTNADRSNTSGKSFTRFFPAAARILMGLVFLIFGLNIFLQFIPQPKTPMPEGMVSFMGAMIKTGYLFRLVGATQVIVGALLLVNRFVPLALVMIAPVLVNILFFHLFLQPAGIGPGAICTLLEIYLVWQYRKALRPMLAARATPGEE